MTTRLKLCLFAMLTSCIANTALSAPVSSMSLETFRDGPERFWEVSVKCEQSEQLRLIKRFIDSDQWCSVQQPGLCGVNKISLARQLCGDSVANREKPKPILDIMSTQALPTNVNNTLKAEQTSVAPESELGIDAVLKTRLSREDLLKEKMQIEEQRILIEEKRLKLRHKEIELQQQLNVL